jgi:predicted CoA-binding protein
VLENSNEPARHADPPAIIPSVMETIDRITRKAASRASITIRTNRLCPACPFPEKELPMSKAFASIAEVLSRARIVAIVGLSAKPERDSHEVAHYLQQHGFRVIPVNPTYAGSHILGEHCYASLTQAAKDNPQIEVVDCFRKPGDIPAVAREAAAIGARCLWMQLGIVSEEGAQIALTAGMTVVMDHCMKLEHIALHGMDTGMA